jgi:flagellar FliL protein
MAIEPIPMDLGAIAAEAPAAAEPKKASSVSLVVELAFLTCFAVGAGGLFGMLALGDAGKPAAKPEPAAQQAPKTRHGEAAALKPLPAIVTNLAGPQQMWIRLEALMVVGDGAADSTALGAAIAEDIVAFLRTVPMAQIEGPSGFLHLREDLNDRARIRSAGKVKELVVQSMVLE